MTECIRLYGIVQGVGMRPFIARTAKDMGLSGTVSNTGSCVEIMVSGSEEELATFRNVIQEKAPKRSMILRMEYRPAPSHMLPSEGYFEIIESEHEEGDIWVSPDLAICPDCERELFDPTNRRYEHPFINCTACGPRLSILLAMPYDRERTSMRHFPMCPACKIEYETPTNRRYDAQPVACNDCGPRVYLLSETGERIKENRDAIHEARRLIMEGKVVAIKGIGGFHLCVDARNEQAVQRLREAKKRPTKPFAVMAKDITVAAREGEISEKARAFMNGPEKPILIVSKKKEGKAVEACAPANPKLGLFLPYTPLHHLMFGLSDEIQMTDVLVMTSGNRQGEPIAIADEVALATMQGIADAYLSNDREIIMRADDSVVEWEQEMPIMIRRSRGYAPLPFVAPVGVPFGARGVDREPVLAIGGELKNTFVVGKGQLLYPSAFIGDMGEVQTGEVLKESVDRMLTLLEIKPGYVVCDLHPRYQTVRIAKELSATWGIPLVQVQHHYAHILSCMCENEVPDEKVIGIALDGTGYGPDNTIWGGEILLSDYHEYRRVGHIKSFLQIGQDAAVREGYRNAISMILEGFGEEASEVLSALQLCPKEEQDILCAMWKQGINTMASTSAGRLFDAVSAILGLVTRSSYEGEAAMRLQFAAMKYEGHEDAGGNGGNGEECIAGREGAGGNGGNREECDSEGQQAQRETAGETAGETAEETVLRTDLIFAQIVRRRLQGEPVPKLAYDFHVQFANLLVEGACSVREQTGVNACALSGGVFQNTLLLHLVDAGLTEKGFTVWKHSMIPPNDGGIALGQASFLERTLAGAEILC